MWSVFGFSTVVLHVVLQHLVLQDPTELRERLQMNHMDDQRSQNIIQRQTEFLQHLTKTNQSHVNTRQQHHIQYIQKLKDVCRTHSSLDVGLEKNSL